MIGLGSDKLHVIVECKHLDGRQQWEALCEVVPQPHKVMKWQGKRSIRHTQAIGTNATLCYLWIPFFLSHLHFFRNHWIIWSIGTNYWRERCFLQEFRIECKCWQKEPQQCFSQDCARLILLPLWVKWDIHHVRHHAQELNLYYSGLQIPCIVLHLWMWNIHTRWTEAISSIGSFLLLKDQIHSRQVWRSGPPKENNAMK